ncbi:MAG: DUF1702 family protein [Planctomycetota bacterium]
MTGQLTILVVASAALLALALSGWWRALLYPLTIRPSRLTVSRQRLLVREPADVNRINLILGSFARGFNRCITGASAECWREYCASLPSLLRPFAHEGAAMGHIARRMGRYAADRFEREIVKPGPEFRYLYYVGLGFWAGMRGYSAERMTKLVGGLDRLHRFLCFDGYGFSQAFFHYRRDPSRLGRLDLFAGYACNAAYQGVGRAFYFLFMDEPDRIVEHLRRLGDHAADAAAGVGLAAFFVNPDRLHKARLVAERIPADLRPHFHLGMCFGAKARAINDVEEFERNIGLIPKFEADAVHAAVRECDRVELLVRSEKRDDGYAEWRARVTAWMVDHIEYPLAGVRAKAVGGAAPSARSVSHLRT